jgi:DNA-binding SARP family transcriptional activator
MCLTGAAAAMKAGDAATGLSLYERVLTHDQLLEVAWTGRMRALHALGRRVEALRSYGDLRRTLRRELGIAPSREAHRLYLALMNVEGKPAEQAHMDRTELTTLLTLLQDALEPMSSVLGPEKVQVLAEIAAEVYRTTSESGRPMPVAA